MSARRRSLQAAYKELLAKFLSKHTRCAVFKWNWAMEVHHSRGRVSTLLLDQRYWVAVSREGHDWINNHPAQARNAGWLAELGRWNSPPQDAETLRLKRWMAELTKGRA